MENKKTITRTTLIPQLEWDAKTERTLYDIIEEKLKMFNDETLNLLIIFFVTFIQPEKISIEDARERIYAAIKKYEIYPDNAPPQVEINILGHNLARTTEQGIFFTKLGKKYYVSTDLRVYPVLPPDYSDPILKGNRIDYSKYRICENITKV